MSTTDPIRRRLITNAVKTRLETLSGVTVYRTEVPNDPPPPTMPGDADGRVAPYVILDAFGGFRPPDGKTVGGESQDLDYGCQIRCVAGYAEDCEALGDRVDALVWLWSPTVSGLVFGRFEPPVGYDPGPVQIDNAVSPPRFYVPLNYRLRATR